VTNIDRRAAIGAQDEQTPARLRANALPFALDAELGNKSRDFRDLDGAGV
jgi:hypothetical protein